MWRVPTRRVVRRLQSGGGFPATMRFAGRLLGSTGEPKIGCRNSQQRPLVPPVLIEQAKDCSSQLTIHPSRTPDV